MQKVTQIILKFKTKEFLRFFFSGLTAFMVDFTILNLLILIFNQSEGFINFFGLMVPKSFKVYGLLIFVPNVISTLFGIITTFTLNKYWAFKSRKKNVVSEGYRFALVLLFNYVVNNILFGIIKQTFYIPDQLIKIITTGIQMFWTFLLYKFFVFKKY